MLALGERRQEMSGGLGIEPRHQPALLVLQQRLQDRLDLLGRLPLAEDDLGKPAPDPAVQVDLGEPSRVLKRLDLDPLGRDAGRHATVSNGVEQLFELVRIHYRPPVRAGLGHAIEAKWSRTVRPDRVRTLPTAIAWNVPLVIGDVASPATDLSFRVP